MNGDDDEPELSARDRELSRMKVHLRRMPIRGTLYRVVTLRPDIDAAYSTNYYHNTWHILSDRHGSRLLARLLFGLAFQKHPNTLLLLAGRHLRRSPFDASPSRPVVVAVKGVCPLVRKDLEVLKSRLTRLPPPATIRWDTRSFTRYETPPNWKRVGRWDRPDDDMFESGGFVCYHAPADELKAEAAVIGRMAPRARDGGMDYHFLAYGTHPDGEVQVFDDYRERLSASAVARQRVLDRLDRRVPPGELEDLVSAERHHFRRNRHRTTGGAKNER